MNSTFVLLNTAGRSFELLVADEGMHTQIFSSDRWEWGPVRNTSFLGHQYLTYDLLHNTSRPAVIGRTVLAVLSKASSSRAKCTGYGVYPFFGSGRRGGDHKRGPELLLLRNGEQKWAAFVLH
jgi:hypothetical protein